MFSIRSVKSKRASEVIEMLSSLKTQVISRDKFKSSLLFTTSRFTKIYFVRKATAAARSVLC